MVRSSNSSSDCHVRAEPRRARWCGRQLRDRRAVERDRARRWHEAGERVDRGRLAGAVRPDQPDELAGLDAQVEVVDGAQPAEGDAQPVVSSSAVTTAPCLGGRGRADRRPAGSVRRAALRALAASTSRTPPAMPSGFRTAVMITPRLPRINVNSRRHAERRLQRVEEDAAGNEQARRDRAADARDAAEIREGEDGRAIACRRSTARRRLPMLNADERAAEAGDERRDRERGALGAGDVDAGGGGRRARSSGSRAAADRSPIAAGCTTVAPSTTTTPRQKTPNHTFAPDPRPMTAGLHRVDGLRRSSPARRGTRRSRPGSGTGSRPSPPRTRT